MQDASPEVQKLIGRVQPFDLVERAADELRGAGIANLNIDLMYGLPGQTAREVARSAELAAALAPQRLALFGYAHVPWFKTHQRLIKPETLPGLGRAAGTGAGRRRDVARPRLRRRSASTISPCPTTNWRSPRASAGCTAISRATPPTRPMP